MAATLSPASECDSAKVLGALQRVYIKSCVFTWDGGERHLGVTRLMGRRARVRLGVREVSLHTLRPPARGVRLEFAKNTSILATELPEGVTDGGWGCYKVGLSEGDPHSAQIGGSIVIFKLGFPSIINFWPSSREIQNVGLLLTFREDEENVANVEEESNV